MIYKIRVILNSTEDIFRDIELKEAQTLADLHQSIITAFELPKDEISMYNMVSDEGDVIKSIPLEDMSDDEDGETMATTFISDIFESKGDIGQFQYGFIELWEFICEFLGESQEKVDVSYPRISYSFGEVPSEAPSQIGVTTVKRNEFDDEFGLDDDDYNTDNFENLDNYLDGDI